MKALQGLTLFDLDLTLLPIDSDHAWGEFVIRAGWVDAAAFRAGNDAFYAQYKRGALDIAAYIAFAAAPLRDKTPAQLAEAPCALHARGDRCRRSGRRQPRSSPPTGSAATSWRSSPRPTTSSPRRSPPPSASRR